MTFEFTTPEKTSYEVVAKTHLPENFVDREYFWDFDDGMKDEGRTVNYQFLTAGVRKVVFSVKGVIRLPKEKGRGFNEFDEIEEVYKEIIVLPAN